MGRIGAIISNVVHVARGVALDVKTMTNEITSNRFFSGTVEAVSEAFKKQNSRGASEAFTRYVNKLGEANKRAEMFRRALEYAQKEGKDIVELGGKQYSAKQLEQILGSIQKQIAMHRANADKAAARLAKATRYGIGAGAKAWFTPEMADPVLRRRDWGAWATRMGITAGALVGLGTAGRLITDRGNMIRNEYGDFDIAGLPFV